MADETARTTDQALNAMLTEAIERVGRGETATIEQLTEVARAVEEASDPGARLALGHAYLLLLGAENGAEVAEEWVTGADPYLRDAGFEALIDFGAAAFHTVAKLARSDRRDVRWYGVEAARLLRDRVALSVLVGALEDDDFAIRWAASRGLAETGEPALVPLLEGLVRTHATVSFHRAVLWALRRLPAPAGHQEAYNALIASLSHSTTVYQSGPLAEQLLQALRAA